MKRFLRALVSWLERKFPDKVTVTLEEWNKVNDRLKFMEDEMKKVPELRIKTIEQEITKFNVSLGFAGSVAKQFASPFQR